MGNSAPKTEKDPKDPTNNARQDVGNVPNDRPSSTYDGISDQGTKAEELKEEKQEHINADREIPESNQDREDVGGQQPPDCDIE